LLKPHFFPFLFVFIIFVVVGGIFVQGVNAAPNIHPYVLDYTYGWNGNYWLIGGTVWHNVTGINGKFKLVRYDGNNFTLINHETGNGLNSINAIAWNGRYWLLGGGNTLWKYNGKKITDLSGELHSLTGNSFYIKTIKWSNGYWLINLWRINLNSHGYSIPIYKTVIYDNSSGFKMVDIKPTSYETHSSSSFNVKYWLIGENYGRLFRYNGRKLVDLSKEIMDEVPHNLFTIKGTKLILNGTSVSTIIYPIAINGSNGTDDWLIIINGAFRDPQLNVVYGEKVLDYNGKNFTDLTEEMHDGRYGFFGTKYNEQEISEIKFDPNDKYWLITGEDGILRKYSHGNFTIVGNMSSMYPMPGEIFSITDMAYNPSDKYWLILGYKSPFHPDTPYGLIMKFNGTKLWDITPHNIFKHVFVNGRVQFTMDGAKWNGKYWLISGGGRLIKYNGTSFEDLTSQFLSVESQTVKASQDVKNQTTVKPQKPQRNYNNLILVIVAVLLFISVVYSLVRLRKR